MKTSKVRIITDYESLDKELKTQLQLDYPNGFSKAIVEFTNNKNKQLSAIRWETSGKIYMLRISNEMLTRILEDEFDFFEAN